MRQLLRRATLDRLTGQEMLSGGFGGFAFARRALAKEWGIEEPASLMVKQEPFPPLYELASGAGSLDEALALGRIASVWHNPDRRTIPVGKLGGPAMPTHDWKRLMAGKKPRPEPLAACVPFDHWYFTAARLSAVADLKQLSESWGSPLRFAQMSGRDARLLERYQEQLRLPIQELAKIDPKLVRAVALTGSDLFWAEGTDLTAIVDTPDPAAFAAVLDRLAPGRPTVQRHREGVIEQRGTQFRARTRERVLVSNSLTALRRVLDTIAGKRPSLASRFDFQYMRTAFPRDPKQEDAFVFLGDDFIRALVSPAAAHQGHAPRPKPGRAAEDQSCGPRSRDAARQETRRHEGDVRRPSAGRFGGRPIAWKDGEASSRTHGTLSHGVPLIDVPIRDVTEGEFDAYQRFCIDYEKLWLTFIDPVGIRMKSGSNALRVEAYMLPLAQNEAYRQLRRWTGGKSCAWDPRRISPNAVAQLRLARYGHRGGVSLQFDDSPELPAWAESVSTLLLYPSAGSRAASACRWSSASTTRRLDCLRCGKGWRRGWNRHCCSRKRGRIGSGRRDGGTHPLNPALLSLVSGEPAPRGVMAALNGPMWPLALMVLPLLDAPPKALHVAEIGKTTYLSFDGKPLDSRIDASKGAPDEKGEPAALGLFLSRKHPGMSAVLEMLLEWRVRQEALAANVMWQSSTMPASSTRRRARPSGGASP